MAVKGFKFNNLTGGGTDALDGQDGDTLSDGDFAMVLNSDIFYPYRLDENSGESESSPDIIAPDTNAGDKRWKLARMPSETNVPCGSIVAWVGGYFTNSINSDYQFVLGTSNSIAAINDYVDPDGFRVCDGSEYNNPNSPIFNGAGRHLPNLTDNRFIMGDTQVGGIGGNNVFSHNHTIAHTHTVDIANFNCGYTTLTTTQIPAHNHQMPWGTEVGSSGYIRSPSQSDNNHNFNPLTSTTGGGGGHIHAINPPATTSGGTSVTHSGTFTQDNRPDWLACVYIMRVV